MKYSVFYGVHRAFVGEQRLLRALAAVARDFDESPKEMLCLLAEPAGDVQWFTFLCSVYQQGAAMAAGFFVDVMSDILRDFAVIQHDDIIGSDVVFTHRGEARLEVRSNGREVIVVQGELPASASRAGDAAHVGLSALGWPTERAWEGIGPTSREVVLRRDRQIARPLAINPRTKDSPRLPPVRVIRGSSEIGFDYWRERAAVRFTQTPLPVAAPPGAVVRFDVFVGRPGVWPDLSAVERITGRLRVVDGFEPDEPERGYGLRVVDLGAVRQMRYPAELYVQGRCERIVGHALEEADTISIRGEGDPRIEMPKLRALRHGSFGDSSEIVLPELARVKRLHIGLPGGPFVVRLPKLEEGALILEAERVDAQRATDSVLEIPLLARKNIEIRVRAQEGSEILRQMLGSGAPPTKPAAKKAVAKKAPAEKAIAEKAPAKKAPAKKAPAKKAPAKKAPAKKAPAKKAPAKKAPAKKAPAKKAAAKKSR